MSVSVRDAQGRVAGKLSKHSFTVLDGKSPQEITFFEERNVPYSIGFLLDTSGSMSKDDRGQISLLRENVLRFMALGHKDNEYFLMTFADRVQILMEWTRDVDTAGVAFNKLALARPKGPTALFDACYLGVEKLSSRTNPRRALILLTDGQDNFSTRKFSALRELVKQSDVVIYAVYKSDLTSMLAESRRGDVGELVSISGGAVFAPSSKVEINEAFESIATEMQHQYTIGFNPASLDGKWHSIRIKVTPLEVSDPLRPNRPPVRMSLSARTRQVFYPQQISR
jgi:Ca-activated chloride channel family protein